MKRIIEWYFGMEMYLSGPETEIVTKLNCV